MLNHGNYYYNVMPFGLKKDGATYQRLMDGVFSHQIGRNLDFHVDDMIVKITKGKNHVEDLEYFLQPVIKYNMRLNLAKCSLLVQARKFIGFMLTKRGIKDNMDKFHVVIIMRSPTNVKEVQQLTGCLATLFRSSRVWTIRLSVSFSTLTKKEKFKWTIECEEAS